MPVIALFGLLFAILAASVIIVLTVIDVVSEGPGATQKPQATDTSPALSRPHSMPLAEVSKAVAPSDSPPVHSGAEVAMSAQLLFSRDTRHLRWLVVLIALGGAGALFVRSQLVPEAFGERGPYRAAALGEIESHPSVLSADANCLKCHTEVQEERAESPHKAVLCMHCHGNGHEHIAAATKAEQSPDHPIPPAEEWDGDFRTKIDLFITQDRSTCLSCHQAVVGMPKDFRSINVAEHLEEQGAEEVNSKNVCFECHAGHSPGI